ncbi:Gfo/Idh/MocA family protein [Bythopirellula goksoeyrii]|uniref:Inositol 2-dehydrogenase n=1 Tax=Bythopirellula goksoeyrii TaxID=1400387 RepID=A0A5B9QI34_9BACT|nr:Gfo/Idh/MocA family oxidoreductase [Bythopirellula goksoeyrii]QEG37619.1 Inositol 2-dehydrogenase [Bythopirellula goksoeyrii]
MAQESQVTRRDFIQKGATGAAVLGAASTFAAPASAQAAGANQRLRIGFIGPGGRGLSGHVLPLAKLREDGASIDLVAVNDVYTHQADKVANTIKEKTGTSPKRYDDYRDLLADKDIDAVCIGTPDHWHAKQTIDAMKAGKHVYCEKPMTHTIEEAFDVVNTWKDTGKVMQVGVQSTALPVWGEANEVLKSGELGKVLMFQTEYFRNSDMGQWRYYPLHKEMTPQTINWKSWLGVDEGLAPDMPFDRAIYAQWRRFWPFGSGMYTDLFVHRTTSMLKATGLRFPRRVVGAGGIYLEYDGRDVPDVATVVADYDEGVQGLITATMSCADTPIKQLIRGHFGSLVFGNGEEFAGFDFEAERPQVTHDSSIKNKRYEVGKINNTTEAHQKNFVDCCLAGTPDKVNCSPELGAAAIVTVSLGSRSYREGKVFHFDPETSTVSDGNADWAKKWEKISHERGNPHHIAGWNAGDKGSKLVDPEYQRLEGPWVDGRDPVASL